MTRSAPTIPIASATGETDIEISRDSWRKIEKALGHTLSDKVRALILEASRQFVYFEAFERNAAPLEKALNRVELIKNATRDLSEALASPPGDIRIYTNHLLGKNFDDPRLTIPHRERLYAIRRVLASLLRACDLALKEMNLPGQGFREGARWDQWIRRLTAIAVENGLPKAAAKSSDKSLVTSPFVLMVEALQNGLPAHTRRHNQSRVALAAAIHRARRGANKRGN